MRLHVLTSAHITHPVEENQPDTCHVWEIPQQYIVWVVEGQAATVHHHQIQAILYIVVDNSWAYSKPTSAFLTN